MSRQTQKTSKKKSDDFAAVAERLECDPDLEKFEKKLGKIAKAKPRSPAKSK